MDEINFFWKKKNTFHTNKLTKTQNVQNLNNSQNQIQTKTTTISKILKKKIKYARFSLDNVRKALKNKRWKIEFDKEVFCKIKNNLRFIRKQIENSSIKFDLVRVAFQIKLTWYSIYFIYMVMMYVVRLQDKNC